MADRTAPLPWRLRLLGAFALERGSQSLTRLHSRAAVLLLARLALEPHAAHARETLAEWLWPQVDAATGRARLRQTLSTLKATLERPGDGSRSVAIRADRLTLQLAPGTIDCDVQRFESAARRGDRAAAAAAWGGELLPGHYDEWVLEQRRRLQALLDPLDLDAHPISGSAPPSRCPSTPPDDGLPHYLTPLIGGEAAVRDLADAASGTRWLVVLGRGGLGKSRLSVHAARRLLADGRIDTARFVAWAGCTTVEDAAARVRLALSQGSAPSGAARPEASGMLDAAADSATVALAGRRALLLLDNAEQLPDAALALVPRLLSRLPGLRVIVTTRRALTADGARTWCPRTLPADGPASAGLQLFVDRARAVRPDFQCHPGNEAAIRSIVRRLEGLPLAIELAAARVRTLPPVQLAERLDQQGAERWHLLARRGAGAAGEPRHASLDAVVATSLALLTPAARRLLDVMASAWAPVCMTMARRHPVVADLPVEPAWQELVADNLLVEAGDDGHGRWCALPEPVRDLVLEHLPKRDVALLHAGWADALASWTGTLAPAWPLARVEQALPLLLSLLADAGPARDEAERRTLQLMLAFAPAWQERHPPASALDALDRAVEGVATRSPPGQDSAVAAAATALAASLALAAGRGARARDLAGRIDLDALEGAPARAQARLLQARVAWRVDADAVGARARLAQARTEAPEHPATMAALLSLEATLANEADRDPARAADAYRMALHWLAAEPQAHAHARRGLRYNLAITAIYHGDAAAALPDLAALATDARAAGDRHLLSQVLNATGSALDLLGRTAEAEQATRAALAEAWATLETENMLYALWNLGPLALAQGDPRRAARLMGFADRFWRTHFGALAAQDARDVARTRRHCRMQLGRAAGQRAWDEGAALPLASAVSLALA